MSESFPFKNHDIAPDQPPCGKVRYDLIPCLHPSGAAVSGLYSAWITLDNPRNSIRTPPKWSRM